jgi:hypothetical protein
MVALYPEDLRREYGDEMAFVFAEELRDADVAGVIRVWRNALGEFFRFALPECTANPAIRVPAIAIAFSIVSLTAEVTMHWATNSPARFVIVATVSTFVPVMIPVAAMWACRGRALTSLHLTNTER